MRNDRCLSGAALPAGLELLLCSARVGEAAEPMARIAAQRVTDWDALLRAADHHGLAPQLHRAVERFGLDVPANAACDLRDAYDESARRSVVLSGTLLGLLDVFGAQGVQALPLKGPVLAESFYEDPALRPSSDLDILVRQRDVPAALRILEREGYARDARLARHPVPALLDLGGEVLLRNPHRPPVDLHWRVTAKGYPFPFDPEQLWRSVRPARLMGRDVNGVTLECLLPYLCVHGARHRWSRLMWLVDVARVAQANPDWTEATRTADRCGVARPYLLGLLLAHDLLAVVLPDGIRERARAEPGIAALALTVVEHLCRTPPAEPGSLELTAFNARMATRPWDKARHYAALLSPTEAEMRLVSLPGPLRSLYYPLRMVRLAAKYTTWPLRRR